MKYIVLLALVVLLNYVPAQKLTTLLPENPIFALGISDLEMLRGKLVNFTDTFEELEIGEALISLTSPQSSKDTYRNMADLWLMVCEEAWVAWANVSAELPALITLAKIHSDYTEDVANLLTDLDAEIKQVGDHNYSLVTFTEGSNVFTEMAYALVGNVFILSSDETTLQEALIALDSKEAIGFATNKDYKKTLEHLKLGQLYNYLDYGELSGVLEPIIQSLEFNKLTSKLTAAISTLGISAGTSRITEDGMITEGVQIPNAKGGDKDLYRLLTRVQPAKNNTLAFVPSNAFAFSSGHNNLAAWWQYIDGLVADTQILGGGLGDLLLAFFGLDVQATFLDWVGINLTTITTGVSKVSEPGVPNENLLGETVYIIETSDEAAMEQGLGQFFTILTQGLAAFADPQGGMGNASSKEADIADIKVSTFNITGGMSLSYAVTDGYALIATSLVAMESVLETKNSESNLETTEAYKHLVSLSPEKASSFSLSNMSASMESTATQLSKQLELFSGLGGAANLDFDKVEQASASVKDYLNFVASCLGYNMAYRQVLPEGIIYNYGEIQISWQCIN